MFGICYGFQRREYAPLATTGAPAGKEVKTVHDDDLAHMMTCIMFMLAVLSTYTDLVGLFRG